MRTSGCHPNPGKYFTNFDEGLGSIGSGTGTSRLNDIGATVGSVDNVVDANNLFAFEYYSEIRDDNDNIFFSPYSISTALAMVYEGAKGKTAEEISDVFHFPEDDDVRRPSFARVYNELNEANKLPIITALQFFFVPRKMPKQAYKLS